MITAYSREGLAEDVLELYELMQRRGILPNQFTFPSVLPACRDLGDVDRGKRIHEDVLRGGFEGDVFVGNALVDIDCRICTEWGHGYGLEALSGDATA
ncbi:hypothetical protein SUGI_0231970 [Cryptomeria japonica]|nr:hypothetical protein SUGI_0231970 [Cryptomeria japonica]